MDLHGNLSQPARDRNLAAFTAGTTRVLVATDIAARGVHVDDVELVVHCDPPAEHKAYLHRSGRTARAGAAGIVVTIATADQSRDVRALTRQAGISPTVTRVVPAASRSRSRGSGGACGARPSLKEPILPLPRRPAPCKLSMEMKMDADPFQNLF